VEKMAWKYTVHHVSIPKSKSKSKLCNSDSDSDSDNYDAPIPEYIKNISNLPPSIKEGDFIENTSISGYRMDGVYRVYSSNGKLYIDHLQDENDEYGELSDRRICSSTMSKDYNPDFKNAFLHTHRVYIHASSLDFHNMKKHKVSSEEGDEVVLDIPFKNKIENAFEFLRVQIDSDEIKSLFDMSTIQNYLKSTDDSKEKTILCEPNNFDKGSYNKFVASDYLYLIKDDVDIVEIPKHSIIKYV
jgi:hypothetical protein